MGGEECSLTTANACGLHARTTVDQPSNRDIPLDGCLDYIPLIAPMSSCGRGLRTQPYWNQYRQQRQSIERIEIAIGASPSRVIQNRMIVRILIGISASTSPSLTHAVAFKNFQHRSSHVSSSSSRLLCGSIWMDGALRSQLVIRPRLEMVGLEETPVF